MKKLWLAAVFLIPGLYSNAYALGNSGFEAGDTSGWTETFPSYEGKISVVSNWSSGGGAFYSPVEGNYFAVVETGVYDGEYTTLSQQFSLGRGDVIEGWAGFCCGEEIGGDNGDYNDYAIISVLNGYGNIVAVPWYSDSFDIAYGWPAQWEHWSWTAHADDFYTLHYQTTQGGDSEGLSYAFFDGPVNEIQTITSTAVPEPSSFALIGLGVAGVIASHRLSRFNAEATPA
ncbi:MAG: PEP-CTERM sorting domain-containing protein [Deltaproteobacteria bacterium]|nr:PEP-CTERM sorting domain-containing protein [Deltaproteobacteria bacterium]